MPEYTIHFSKFREKWDTLLDMEWKRKWMEMVHKISWIGLDLGQTVDLKRYDRYGTFTKHDISNTETMLYLKKKYTGDVNDSLPYLNRQTALITRRNENALIP